MEGTLPLHAAVQPTIRQQKQQIKQQQQQQQQHQRHAHQQQQQQQQLNLQLQHQMDTLQNQISNMHLEFDANNRNVSIGGSGGVVGHLTTPRGHHHLQQQQQHHHYNQQQQTASPTLMSSSSSSSMTSASTMSARPSYGRRNILPRYPDPDPDAIEIYTDEQEKQQQHMNNNNNSNNRKVSMCRQQEHQQHQFYYQHSQEQQQQQHQIQHMGNLTPESRDNLQNWSTAPTLHTTHDYSYAYYEPGVPMRHSNIPTSNLILTPNISPGTPLPPSPQTPPPNSIRALLSKGKKNKLLVSAATRQSYQSRYKMRTNAEIPHAPILQHNNTLPSHNTLMMHENFYEEISSTETIEASPRSQVRPSATYHSAGSLNQSLVEEELRRVQTRHRKILGELNLSVEVMLMPKSPPIPVTCNTNHNDNDNDEQDVDKSEQTPTNIANMSTELSRNSRMNSMRMSSAASADNISANTVHNACSQLHGEDAALASANTSISASHNSNNNNNITQSGFCAADLDSGFSGSSGASYIGSLRLQKTNAALTQLKYARQTIQNSCENINMCTFPYATQSCRHFHSTGAVGGLVGHVSAAGGANVNKLSSTTITMLPPEHEANDSRERFFIHSSCGRVLNCAKIRAAADPIGPIATVPTESIARTFWHRKGWRKLPGLSNSTSSINNTGLTTTTTNSLKLLQPFVSSYIYLKRSTTFRKT